ncbi:hypothetical protein FS749_009216 [Ceratobasidium sp. UAMH 11750]|nr:hypothetical protein FS749_009216 [Ceratobasidium sp. UAMH 11750]
MAAKIDNVITEIQTVDTPGISRRCPDLEATYLAEEYLYHERYTLFSRVLSSFEFSSGGLPTVVDASLIPEDGSSDLEVIGVIGTIHHKEGLFAQCGWFGNQDLDWFWVRIKGIRQIRVCQDSRFRCGEKCVWLHTSLGEYALLLPHDSYREKWEQTVKGLGPGALSAMFVQWPACGPRPRWWHDRWKDDWPFEKDAGSKRRASMDADDYEESMRRPDVPLPSFWPTFGPRSERHTPGQMTTNLVNFNTPWSLRADGGMMPTHSPSYKKQARETVTMPTAKRGRAKHSKRR